MYDGQLKILLYENNQIFNNLKTQAPYFCLAFGLYYVSFLTGILKKTKSLFVFIRYNVLLIIFTHTF